MGQNLTLQKLKHNLHQFFPKLEQYQAYEQNTPEDEPVFIWQDATHQKSLLQYHYWTKDQNQYNNLLNAFVFRYNSQYLVASKFIIVQVINCQYFVRIFYQRSISNLSHFKQIPYTDMGYFMIQSLNGFYCLKKRFGNFCVSEKMFHITDKKQVKIWIKQETYDNRPKLQVCSQFQMIEQILDVVQRNTHKEQNINVAFYDQLKRRVNCFDGFEKSIQNVKQIIEQGRFNMQSQQTAMKCLSQLQYKQLISIMQSTKSKIKKKHINQTYQNTTYNRKQHIQNFNINTKYATILEKPYHTQQNFYQPANNQIKMNQTSSSLNKDRSKSVKRSGISLTKNQRSSSVQMNSQNSTTFNQSSNLSIVSIGKSKNPNKTQKNPILKRPPTPPTPPTPPIVSPLIPMQNKNQISKISVKYMNKQNLAKQKPVQYSIIQKDQNTIQKQSAKYATGYDTPMYSKTADFNYNAVFNPFTNITNVGNRMNSRANSSTQQITTKMFSSPKYVNQRTSANYGDTYEGKQKSYLFQINRNFETNSKANYSSSKQKQNANKSQLQFQIPKIFVHSPVSHLQQNTSINSNQKLKNNFNHYYNYPQSKYKYSVSKPSQHVNQFPLQENLTKDSQNLYTDPFLYQYLTNNSNKSLPYSSIPNIRQNNSDQKYQNHNKNKNKQKLATKNPLQQINISESINFTQKQMERMNENVSTNNSGQKSQPKQKQRKFDIYFPTITEIEEANQSARQQQNQSFLPLKNVSPYKLSTRRRGTEESVVVEYQRFYDQPDSNSNRYAISPLKNFKASPHKQQNMRMISKPCFKRFVSYQPAIDPSVLQDLNRMRSRQFI